MKNLKVFASIAIAAFLLTLALASVSLASPPEVGPGQAPRIVNISSSESVVTTTVQNKTAIIWGSYSYADIFYTISGTSGNTTTIKLQVSPDNVTWIDHSSYATSNYFAKLNQTTVASYTGNIPVHGYYVRLTYGTTSTSPVTFTVKAVLR
jgi:hypothetical protein